MTLAHCRARPLGREDFLKIWARADEVKAQRDARPVHSEGYNRPEDRKRATGSTTVCLRKTQRATANPTAA